MKLPGMLLMAVTALVAGSCTGNNPPPQDTPSAGITAPAQDHGQAPAAKNSASSNAPTMKENVPPKDAQYTLFCEVYRGPGHVQKAMEAIRQLKILTKRDGWHALHGEDQSTVYYGYYSTYDDVLNNPAETKRAQEDRRMIENIRDELGNRRFPNVLFMAVDMPDPKAPPEWNLANAPANMFWSLQIAAYQGSPERKKYAVDGVTKLRALGIPAFYYHGDTISSVCVGEWPKSAVKQQDSRDDAHAVDPTQPIMVFSDQLPPDMSPEVYRNGQRVKVEAPKLEIEDPSLADMIKKFPTHAINGEEHARSGGGVTIKDPSFLVQVPHRGGIEALEQKDPNPLQTNAPDAAADAILNQQPAAQQPTQPGLGKLRSIGDQ
ncbi:MAG TPA: hypothetical protein VFW23_13845 [Tepidisphaeraceae bacterium]|nr:hypothetical protein [Tepidisphaeraceae bacterium]